MNLGVAVGQLLGVISEALLHVAALQVDEAHLSAVFLDAAAQSVGGGQVFTPTAQ